MSDLRYPLSVHSNKYRAKYIKINVINSKKYPPQHQYNRLLMDVNHPPKITPQMLQKITKKFMVSSSSSPFPLTSTSLIP